MEATSPEAPATPVRPGRRQLLLGAGHLAGLWAITFAQPLLDLLGKNPDFFVARGNSVGDILILAFGFVLVPPLVMLAIEWVALKISDKLYMGIHFLFVAAIAAFLFFQFQKTLGLPTILVILIGIGLGVLFAWALFRSPFLKNLMDILIAAPVVVLVMFIFFSNTHKLIFPDNQKIELASNPSADTPVVLVVFDELGTNGLMTNNRTIDAKRFPNFAKLARTSTWYKNESTTAFFTPRAVPGVLTGNDPPPDTLPTSADQPNSIFTQLGKDYKFHVLEPVTQICPEQLCPDEATGTRQLRRLRFLASDLKYVEGRLVLPEGLADKLPDVGTNFEGFGDDGEDGGDAPKGGTGGPNSKEKSALFVKGRGGASEPAEYESFINAIPKDDKAFTMMHLHIPHQPWKYDVSGEQYNTSPTIEQVSKSTGPWQVNNNGVATTQERAVTQTGYADTLVGEVRKALIRKGLWDKAMVIFTADHGISFEGRPVPQRQADDKAMGDVANPPLFIKYPGQKKGVLETKHSMTIDIVPTIAKTLGLKLNYEPDGVPLQDPVPDRPVEVEDIEGNVYSVTVDEMIRQREAGIARTNKRLGTGPIYTLGPAPRLIGTPAPPAGEPDVAAKASLDEPKLYEDYQPGEDLIPMFITGSSDGLDEGTLLAIGVNGAIRGTAKTFEFDGADRFGTVVDPASFKAGSNRITIYEVDGRKLTPVGGN